MKHIFYLLLCCFTVGLSAQETAMVAKSEGMTFVEKPFDELLAQAKAEDKVIFIDAYTTWCGPCKMMARNVFPDKKVGVVYNERFINAKIDMEKGEGPEIARRYGVMAYPTYLFVDGNGDIVHKGLGYIPQEQFLALADAASGDNNLGALNKRYDNGERGGAFMRLYAEVLTNVMEQGKANKIAGEYLDAQENWSSPETLQLLVANPGEVGGKRMKYLTDNADAAIAATSGNAFVMALQQQLVTKRMREIGKRGFPAVEEMSETYQTYGGQAAERLLAHYKMLRAQRMNETEAYLPAAVAYFNTYGSDDAAELNSAAWMVYESSNDVAQLKSALEWAKKSVELEADYPNLDTLAWLYQKTGDLKKAKATAKRAIEMAKATKRDYSETEKILGM